MSIKKIFVPTSGPQDRKGFLADPEKQWAKGYTARTIALCWENARGFPPEILNTLVQSPSLKDIEPLLIFPEWKVPLPGGNTSSQNDVWILGKCRSENSWFNAFRDFAALFGAHAEMGSLLTVSARNNMPLHVAWCLITRTSFILNE